MTKIHDSLTLTLAIITCHIILLTNFYSPLFNFLLFVVVNIYLTLEH